MGLAPSHSSQQGSRADPKRQVWAAEKSAQRVNQRLKRYPGHTARAAKAKCNRQPDAADWPLGKKSQDTERGLGVQGPAGTSALQVKPFWTLALEPRPVSCPRELISTLAGGGQAGAGIQLLLSPATESRC